MKRSRRLQVVPRPPQRRPRSRLRRIVDALLLMAAGVGLLVLLLLLPERIDLNSLLLVSTAIGHLIAGLSRLLMGLIQLLGVLLLVGIALLALALLLGGLVGLVRALVDPPPPPPPGRSAGRP
jgi:hypothetical protein